jgi:hypothetical protein
MMPAEPCSLRKGFSWAVEVQVGDAALSSACVPQAARLSVSVRAKRK